MELFSHPFLKVNQAEDKFNSLNDSTMKLCLILKLDQCFQIIPCYARNFNYPASRTLVQTMTYSANLL